METWRGLHVVEDGGGHVGEGARGEVFEDEGVPGAAALVELRGDGGGDGLGDAVGDERDLFVGLDAQAGGDGGAGAGREFGRDRAATSRWEAVAVRLAMMVLRNWGFVFFSHRRQSLDGTRISI